MTEKPMSINKDRKKYYCKKLKKHVWVLGYFGGGAIVLGSFLKVAAQFSEETGAPIETIAIIEIDSSQRFKRFKYITSDEAGEDPLPDSVMIKDVYKWLYD